MKLSEVVIGKSYILDFPDAESVLVEAVGKSNKAVIVEDDTGWKCNVNPRVLREL